MREYLQLNATILMKICHLFFQLLQFFMKNVLKETEHLVYVIGRLSCYLRKIREMPKIRMSACLYR